MGLLSQVPTHTQPIFDAEKRRVVLDKTIELIRCFEKYNNINIDAVVGCGFSGIPLATLVSHITEKSLICVRKVGDTAVASSEKVHYSKIPANCQYLILEDIISSGRTVNNILKRMRKNRFTCAGILLYNSPNADPNDVFYGCHKCRNEDFEWWSRKCGHNPVEYPILSVFNHNGLPNFGPLPARFSTYV